MSSKPSSFITARAPLRITAGTHCDAVALRGAYHGAAERIVFEAFAALEILLGRGFQRAQISLRMLQQRLDSIGPELRAVGAGDRERLIHQRADQAHPVRIFNDLADRAPREGCHGVES